MNNTNLHSNFISDPSDDINLEINDEMDCKVPDQEFFNGTDCELPEEEFINNVDCKLPDQEFFNGTDCELPEEEIINNVDCKLPDQEFFNLEQGHNDNYKTLENDDNSIKPVVNNGLDWILHTDAQPSEDESVSTEEIDSQELLEKIIENKERIRSKREECIDDSTDDDSEDNSTDEETTDKEATDEETTDENANGEDEFSQEEKEILEQIEQLEKDKVDAEAALEEETSEGRKNVKRVEIEAIQGDITEKKIKLKEIEDQRDKKKKEDEIKKLKEENEQLREKHEKLIEEHETCEEPKDEEITSEEDNNEEDNSEEETSNNVCEFDKEEINDLKKAIEELKEKVKDSTSSGGADNFTITIGDINLGKFIR